ncbi:RluA family pseudouridine synthase [Pseudoalteromonas tunicata]|uniref:RluA family pseudouridine synthase n=1 Tax=Pseudoalteromonas tunicata TaxID=314281 RepID=UPI00273CFF4A|nr:RluA family pseudouridine synthase [Pseudoalteromonas tunicata]MDP4984948.1 RluA family pseudouridine synthase [Pseudoalteromonas tunicata]
MQIFEYHPPIEPWLNIVHVDKDIIVIDKQSGLLSNPGRAAHTFDCALTRLQQAYPETLLVHRLDCATSGIMVFARSKKAESHLKTQFQDRQNKKVYIAEVAGHLAEPNGTILAPLMADKENPPYQKVSPLGKSAISHYQVLEQRPDSSLVELTLETGRTHQLRVHMLHLGHPILGDDFYGDEAIVNARPRLCLHATELSIIHPYSGKTLSFTSPHPF